MVKADVNRGRNGSIYHHPYNKDAFGHERGHGHYYEGVYNTPTPAKDAIIRLSGFRVIFRTECKHGVLPVDFDSHYQR